MQARASDPINQTQSISRWFLLILAVVAVAWFGTLGVRKLLNPDEGRYAEIPREMTVTGDWITPRLNDLKYFEKPPLQYWATAVAYEAFGTSEFTSRLWCGLTGFLGILLAGFAGAKLFGKSTGVVACALLASSLMWVILGHLNTLDMSVSFFLEATLFAFLFAQQAPKDSQAERNWMLAAWALAALACLTKGLEAIVLPGLAFVVYSIVEREFSAWRRLHPIGGLAVFLAIAAPWFVLVSKANPEFPHFFFIHEHFERFLTDVHERVEPWWYFIPLLIVGALPWTSVAVQGVRSTWRTDAGAAFAGGFRPRRFLLIWVLTTMLFFSASQSKLAPYILPVIPALALVIAEFVTRLPSSTVRKHLIAIAIIWSAALVYLFFGPLPTKRDTPPALFAALFHWAEAGAVLALAGAAIGIWLVSRERIRDAMVSLGLGTLLGLSVLLVGFDAAREIRSGYDLSQAIKPHHDARKPFYSISDYDQSMPFYLERTVTLVAYRNELDFGLNQEPQKGMPDLETFSAAWANDPTGSIAVIKHETYRTLQQRNVPMTEIARNIDLTAVVKP